MKSPIVGRGKLLVLIGIVGYVTLDALDHANIIPNGFDRLFIEFCSRMAELVGGVGAAQWITEFAERFAPPRK